MATVQIPNLPAVVGLSGTELFEGVQSGTSVKIDLNQIISATRGGLPTTLPIPTSLGGTGLVSFAVGDIPYASTTTANTGSLATLADVATGNVLLSGGVGAAPLYGKVGLTTHISGILPVANGGTNISAYAVGDITYASATNTLARLPASATGNVILSGTTPSYGKVGLTTHISGVLSVANGGTNIASYAIGDITYASAPTILSALTAAATGNVLLSGTTPSYGKVGLTTHVTGTLPIANGGTSATSSAAALTALGAAPLSSPSLTGTPTAPTATTGTNTTQLATTAFVTTGFVPQASGQGIFQDGSAAAPSQTFTGDTDTGIFHPAANTLAFGVGGTEYMRITSANTLNIGSPNAVTAMGPARISSQAVNLTQSTWNSLAVMANIVGPTMAMGKTRGPSIDQYTIVVTGDQLGSYEFWGADGSTMLRGALIQSAVVGTPAAGDVRANLLFFTASGAAGAQGLRMTIDGSNITTTLPIIGTTATAAPGTNTTALASTAFVTAGLAAGLVSPALTGTPTAPTATAGTNTTQLATTAFVKAGSQPIAITAAGVGQFLLQFTSGGVAMSLPAGGTWAYFVTAYTSAGVLDAGGNVGVAAGGSQIGAASGTKSYNAMIWRIA